MRGGKGFFQCFRQQMKVHGNKQAAEQNSPGKISRQEQKSQDADHHEQDPVGTGHKRQYPFLNLHFVNL
jgi:ABC-type nickel/cobalt efflux system permease component RcnA